MNFYKKLARPLLFSCDPEKAHHATLRMLGAARMPPVRALLRAISHFEDPRLEVQLGALKLKNPIGLAAGLDKDCDALEAMTALGFGFVEIGTVTARPQPGNPRPRIFRLPVDSGLINRMGFPSGGSQKVAANLKRSARSLDGTRLGINVGKNKDVALDDAAQSYCDALQPLQEFADYIVLNVSSPNTPELRKLQEPERLTALVRRVQQMGAAGTPVFIKIAPDLSDQELREVIDVVRQSGVSGVIATNTTSSRVGLQTRTEEAGGLSGAPLRDRSCAVVSFLYRELRDSVPIVGAGGVASADDAWRMFEAGASAVQIYTGLIYEGPLVVKKIKQGLIARLDRSGLSSIRQIIGRSVEDN